MTRSLAVLEGKWWANSNVTVRYLFDCLSHLLHDTTDGYYYEMFCNGTALDNVVTRVALMKDVRYVLIAAHGSEQGIFGSDGQCITRAKVRNIISGFKKSSIDGIYFSTCLFADEENARFLLLGGGKYQATPAKWIAGYSEPVDWLESSVLDLFFWTSYLRVLEEGTTSPHAAVTRVAETIKGNMSGLAEKLGFQIFVRKRGIGGGVTGLL